MESDVTIISWVPNLQPDISMGIYKNILMVVIHGLTSRLHPSSWTAIGGSSRPVEFVDITFENIDIVVNSSHYNFHMYHGHAYVIYGFGYIEVNDVIEFPLASAGGATITIPEPISTFETVPLKRPSL